MSVNAVEYVINAQNKASGALNAAASSMRRLASSTSGAATAMKALVAVQIGGMLASGFNSARASVEAYVNELRKSVDATGKLAARTGIAVESLQSFQVAGGLSGVGDMTEMISKMGTTIGQALVDPARKKAFTDMGMDFEQLARMAPEDQFRAIGDAINSIPSPAAKAAAATKIFSEQGVKLLPLFAGNLSEIEAKAQRLGIVLSGQQVGAIESMNDALSLVDQTFKGIIGQVTANLAPIVTSMANEFMGFVEGFQGVAGATGGNALADAITSAFFDVAAMFAEMFDSATAKFFDFGAILQSFVSGLQSVVNVFVIAIETMKIAFNIFVLAGAGISTAIGSLLEGLGWFSSALGDFGRDLKESGKKQIESTVKSMEQSGGRIGRAMAGTLFDSENRPGGPGAAARAVQQARDAFSQVRAGKDPAEEAKRQREREAAILEAQRAAASKQAAERLKTVINEAASAQKEMGRLVETRDKMLAERAERLSAKSPENQAVVDRFGSRGPFMQANERTAKATEELAKLNKEIAEKQEKIQKAAIETAKNTSGFLALGTV